MIELYHHPMQVLGCRDLMLTYVFGAALVTLAIYAGSLAYDRWVNRIFLQPASRRVARGAAVGAIAVIFLVPLLFPSHFAIFVGVSDTVLSTQTCYGYREDRRDIVLFTILSVRFDVSISQSQRGTSYRPYFLIRYDAPSQDFQLDLEDIYAPDSLAGLERISVSEANSYRKWLGL